MLATKKDLGFYGLDAIYFSIGWYSGNYLIDPYKPSNMIDKYYNNA